MRVKEDDNEKSMMKNELKWKLVHEYLVILRGLRGMKCIIGMRFAFAMGVLGDFKLSH